jgi:hypothetical protein
MDRRPALELKLVSERITPREIIQRRVASEVEAFNNRKLAHAAVQGGRRSFLIDVEATSPEAILNASSAGRRTSALARVEREAARAFQAFEKRRFIMLLDDRQLEGLDDDVTVGAESQIVFLYLMPLKGG